MTRPSDLMKPHPDLLQNDPQTGEGESALLIVQTVVCACGAHWTDSQLIFKGAGYSYHLTEQRYNALLDGSLPLVGQRVHERLVPVCFNCRAAALPHGWPGTEHHSPSSPHYPYDEWPDQHKAKLVRKARTKPARTEDETKALVDKLLDF